jgi:uncharacterized SAM-binding protein YcdF (DUF218 family)
MRMGPPPARYVAGFRHRSLRLASGAVLVLLAWLGGLLYFASRIPDRVDDPVTATDAIVVLTGGSDRLQEGLRLLAAGKAKRLLISGVNREATLADILKSAEVAPDSLPPLVAACCITVGYQAGNTAGNARETADWMAANTLRSLRLVTADYHMPRSLLEFARAMPGIAIVPHPVFPEEVKRDEWWLWPGTASLLVNEYHKYLVAVARGWFDDVTRKLAAPPS